MSDQARDVRLDSLIAGVGELKGTVGGMAREVSELRANAVTREVLEAKIGPTQRFIYGLIALVLLAVGGAIVQGVVSSRQTAPSPKIEIIIPTSPPQVSTNGLP